MSPQRSLRHGFLILMLGLSWLGLGAVEPVIVPAWPGLPPGAKVSPNDQESTRKLGDSPKSVRNKLELWLKEQTQP